MEEIYQKGGIVVATTHYGEVKRFSQEHEDFVTAAMAFDQENLKPLYHLIVGEVGESQALWIAQKMAISKKVIDQAQKYIDKEAFTTARKVFKQTVKMKSEPKESYFHFQKGDRVELTETKQIGLIYHDHQQEKIAVFVKEEVIEVLRKRVKLLAPATELYPLDYDLDQLFTDYHVRKEERDLLRGSKKAHKALDKAARKRSEGPGTKNT